MFASLKNAIILLRNSEKTSVALRWRLQIFLLSFAAIIFSVIMLFVVVFDVFSPHKTAATSLELQLARYEHRLTTYFSNTAAQGIHFSRQLAKEIDKILSEQEISFDDVADNQKLIALLQSSTYGLMRDAFHIADCSGSFIIFDTTVNTKLPNAKNSRSGMYLKLANVNTPKPVNPLVLWTRGIHELGHENNHLFHNKWELEFDVSKLPFYKPLIDNASRELIDSYYYSPAFTFPGTWEKIMVLCVPIVGKNGDVYGVCGFELNSIFFKLLHAESGSQYDRLTGLVAQRQGDIILLGTGLEFGTKDGYFAGLGEGNLTVQRDGSHNHYLMSWKESGSLNFIGLDKDISLSPFSDTFAGPSWTLVCMIPQKDYDCTVWTSYMKLALFCASFLVVVIVLTYVISRRFNLPILKGLDAIKEGSMQKTYINEIDDLLEFMAANDKIHDADMSAFYEFKENIKDLSRAETAIFNLYMEGYSAARIAEMLYISINTLKSHNKNIYRKLNVTSRKELMVYAQMMKTAE